MEVVFTAPEIEGLYVLKLMVDNNNQCAKVGCVSDVSANELIVNKVNRRLSLVIPYTA